MEREPLEPAVLAVELFREENRHRRRTGMIALAGLSCALVGGLAVLGAMKFAPHLFGEQTAPVQVATNPPVKSQQLANDLYTEPKSEPTPPPKGLKTKEEPPKVAANPNSEPSGTVPFNPLSGAIISRSDVPPDWKPGQAAPPTAGPKPPEPPDPAPKVSGAFLVTARVGGGDPESEAAGITSTLQGAGASVRAASHYNLAGGVIGVQIVATCPAASVDGLMAKLGGANKWSGSIDDRSGRVSGMISGRIRELRAKEAELKEKFEDDATEVAVVREEIQKLNQGLAMARSARSAGIAVIVIGIGSL
jgi:hypothetical protein